MNKPILEKIKKAAKKDEKNRKDKRYLRTMGFLIRKGMLRANRSFEEYKQGKLNVTDAIWAGKNVEPRILEVLPATVARLPKEVASLDLPEELLLAVKALAGHQKDGPDFMGVPFKKYRVWSNLPINDKRSKPIDEKKIMRSFRLSPNAIKNLEQKAKATGKSATEVLEEFLS